MKKRISLLLTVLLLTGMLVGCQEVPASGNGLSVVTTIFPEYDWVMNVLGEKAALADVTMLLDNGVDLHSYQPTAEDMIKISNCDLFVYVGGSSDAWVEDALRETVNPDRIAINLMEILGSSVKTEEAVEGMEAEEEADEGAEDAPEYDEHVWLSLKNAAVFVEALRDALIKTDAANADTYTANTAAYLEKLDVLDGKFEAMTDAAPLKTVLFGDRFPFRYLVDDYGLSYFAAFAGCSAESEASFETISFLAAKLDALELPAVLTLEGTRHKIAETVIAASQTKTAQILTMDSMQSTTAEDVQNGASYLSLMEKNLQALTKALQ